MLDQHAGKAGSFVIDPKTGLRLTQAEWDKQQNPPLEILPKSKKKDKE